MTRLEENYKKNCITFPRLFNPRFLLLYPRFRIARLINNFVAINAFAMSVERNFCRVSEGGKKPVERTISGKEGEGGNEEEDPSGTYAFLGLLLFLNLNMEVDGEADGSAGMRPARERTF